MGLFDMLFSKQYKSITTDELKELLKDKDQYQFLDVRTKQEYKHGHIKGFNRNLDYYKFARNHSMIERLDKHKPVVIICATGSRSAGAAHLFSKLGYDDVINVRRGIASWNGPLIK